MLFVAVVLERGVATPSDLLRRFVVRFSQSGGSMKKFTRWRMRGRFAFCWKDVVDRAMISDVVVCGPSLRRAL